MTLYAAIDMGTGAMRTLFARMDSSGMPVVEGRKNYRYTLADDIRRGVFSDERMAEVAACCAQAMADIRASGAVFTGAAATEAFRRASNGEALINLIQQTVGLSVRLISGEDELRMSYLGAAPYIYPHYTDIFFADSGGGSTEVAHIHHPTSHVHSWTSLKLGLVTHLHLIGDDVVVGKNRFGDVKDTFKEIILSGCSENGINLKNKPLVMAGAPLFLVAYQQAAVDPQRNDYCLPGAVISHDDVAKIAHEMYTKDRTWREANPLFMGSGVQNMLPAAAKTMALMEVCGVESFQTVPSGIALALMLENADKQTSESA